MLEGLKPSGEQAAGGLAQQIETFLPRLPQGITQAKVATTRPATPNPAAAKPAPAVSAPAKPAASKPAPAPKPKVPGGPATPF